MSGYRYFSWPPCFALMQVRVFAVMLVSCESSLAVKLCSLFSNFHPDTVSWMCSTDMHSTTGIIIMATDGKMLNKIFILEYLINSPWK